LVCIGIDFKAVGLVAQYLKVGFQFSPFLKAYGFVFYDFAQAGVHYQVTFCIEGGFGIFYF
jgi:hypothetical protein